MHHRFTKIFREKTIEFNAHIDHNIYPYFRNCQRGGERYTLESRKCSVFLIDFKVFEDKPFSGK